MDQAHRAALRPVAAADESFLYELYASTRQAELERAPWPAEAKQAFLRTQFEAQLAHYHARFPDARHSIITFEEARAGRLYVDRQDSQILIIDLTLAPEFHRRGIGQFLISGLQAEAAVVGKRLTGHVDRWNPAAVFWRRMGFEIQDSGGIYCPISWNGGQIA